MRKSKAKSEETPETPEDKPADAAVEAHEVGDGKAEKAKPFVMVQCPVCHTLTRPGSACTVDGFLVGL